MTVLHCSQKLLKRLRLDPIRKEDGSQLTVNAKAVIVSTGSFAGNESMMREALGTAYDNVSGMSVAAYVNIEGTGLGFALTSGRLAGANAAAASK